jgi:hypothetical protein
VLLDEIDEALHGLPGGHAALRDRLATALALFGKVLAGTGVHAAHVGGTGGNALLSAAGAP